MTGRVAGWYAACTIRFTMHDFVQHLLVWYFHTLQQFGLLGVMVLMAMESSIFPVPSELVMPPAAYVESHAKGGGLWLTALVILAGTLGSYLGSSITYWVSRLVGRPLIVKYGKYVLLPEHKLHLAERWVARYGAWGIFFARLLPGVRHVNAIPAGLMDLRFFTFSVMTLLGSFVWCTVLTIFGLVMAQDIAVMVQGGNFNNPAFEQAFHNLTLATVGMVVVVVILYVVFVRVHGRHDQPAPEQPAEETPINML